MAVLRERRVPTGADPADPADPAARWGEVLDRLEAALGEPADSAAPPADPATDGLGPLPAVLLPRARALLEAQHRRHAELAAQRDAVAAELAALTARGRGAPGTPTARPGTTAAAVDHLA